MKKRSFMKAVAAVLMAAVCALAFVPAQPAQADQNVRVYLNNREITNMDQPPIIVDGRVLVPMRAIFEAMSCEVTWNDANQSIVATNMFRTVVMVINSTIIVAADTSEWENAIQTNLDTQIFAERHASYIDVPPLIYNGRTLVPLRAVADAMEADIQWDGNARAVYITW